MIILFITIYIIQSRKGTKRMFSKVFAFTMFYNISLLTIAKLDIWLMSTKYITFNVLEIETCKTD